MRVTYIIYLWDYGKGAWDINKCYVYIFNIPMLCFYTIKLMFIRLMGVCMNDIKQFIRDLLNSSKIELVILIVAFILDIIPYSLNYEFAKLNTDLISVATTIFTVSGIFISFSTLVIQHISDKRGTVIMKLFLKDEVFLKFLAVIVYLSIILLLNAVMKVFNVYLVLIVILGILVSLYSFLLYIKKVSEIVNPSKSIWYVLENLSKEELSDNNIGDNRCNENTNKEDNGGNNNSNNNKE